jgi:hypothetical protein
MIRKSIVTAIVGTALVFGTACTPNAIVEKIQEDDPRWDCETMGNKICGPEGDRNLSDCEVDENGFCKEPVL